MKVLRTPEGRFAALPEFPYAPRYTEIGELRMAHVEAGRGRVVLLLHGEPTWSFLYRKMIPVIAESGFRAVAPDLVGFGRSDKPAATADYTYARHVEWVLRWIAANELNGITLVCQDWGSLIGLRLAAEHPERFDRIVVANGFLPIADRPAPRAFKIWRAFARYTPVFPTGWILQVGTTRRLPAEVIAGYEAPFPSEAYRKGARAFPRLVPTEPDDPRGACESPGVGQAGPLGETVSHRVRKEGPDPRLGRPAIAATRARRHGPAPSRAARCKPLRAGRCRPRAGENRRGFCADNLECQSIQTYDSGARRHPTSAYA